MTELSQLTLYAVLGLSLGSLYYWGLWVTVKVLPGISRPAIWMLASILLRFSLILGALFLIARFGEWPELLMVIGGLILSRTIARILVVRHWPSRATSNSGPNIVEEPRP